VSHRTPEYLDDAAEVVPLTNGGVAYVDAEDASRALSYRWRRDDNGYARHSTYARDHNGKRVSGSILLHRFIAGAPMGVIVDHKNGDTLNCRRSNLRPATPGESSRNGGMRRNNTSGYKGVSWHKQAGKWHAYITVDWKRRSLGVFDTKESAARAYNDAARQLHGAFARLNEIEDAS